MPFQYPQTTTRPKLAGSKSTLITRISPLAGVINRFLTEFNSAKLGAFEGGSRIGRLFPL